MTKPNGAGRINYEAYALPVEEQGVHCGEAVHRHNAIVSWAHRRTSFSCRSAIVISLSGKEDPLEERRLARSMPASLYYRQRIAETEGSEMEVFESGRETILRHRLVLIVERLTGALVIRQGLRRRSAAPKATQHAW
jgi:hypothetical protein